MKAGLTIIGVGLLVAGIAWLGWATSDETLDEERLNLATDRANLNSASGTGGYRIDLTHLEEGDRVVVEWAFRNGMNGTVSIRERAELEPQVAPPPREAVAYAEGNEGTLTFVAPEPGEYAVAVESEEGTPRGAVRITWDPPQESGRNPVYLGAVRTSLVLAGILGVPLLVASALRGRRRPSPP